MYFFQETIDFHLFLPLSPNSSLRATAQSPMGNETKTQFRTPGPGTSRDNRPNITFHLFLVHRNVSIQLEPSKLETNLETSSAFHFLKVLLKRNWFPKVILIHPPLHYQPREKTSSHLGPV